MKSEDEKRIELWWDSLNTTQTNWLCDKFFNEDKFGINTLDKVVQCYISLTPQDLLELHGLKD